MDFEENAQIEEKTPEESELEPEGKDRNNLPIFAERLHSAREKAEMPVRELAERLSVSESSVYKWESALAEPGLKIISEISSILDVPADYLLGLTDSDGSAQSLTINDRAKAILERVRDKSDEQALFFETTFTRYIEQISLLKKLKKAIDDNGVLITKVNVKGDENQISNPALKDYVSVSAQANDTGKLLIRFVQDPLEGDSDKDELELFLAGR